MTRKSATQRIGKASLGRRPLYLNVLVVIACGVASGEERGPRFLEQESPARSRTSERSIRVNVSLVLVPVTITDRMGRIVDSLERNNFRIFEDGRWQQIVSFSKEDVPCSAGLLFDVSGSMIDKMAKAHEAARAFLGSANAECEFFLITFADRPTVAVELTTDLKAIQNRLLFVKHGGSTALVDAVYLGLDRMRFAHHARKALLIVSDGGDNNSRYSEQELRRFVEEAGVQIHGIGIHDNPRAQEEMHGSFLLDNLAKATGGLHLETRNINELPEMAAKIGMALRSQYVLGYYSSSGPNGGKWRRIRVALEIPQQVPGLHVYSRGGYSTAE
jgi:Ca-activated chloride channel homolog